MPKPQYRGHLTCFDLNLPLSSTAKVSVVSSNFFFFFTKFIVLTILTCVYT